MVNDKNLINKLTKGFKLKINKKKKSNWKTLNSKESLPPTPSEDLMLYSDTEAELYQAKVNVLANRSYVSYSNNNNSFNNESNFNTDNILAGLNSNDNFVGRSKTTYTRPTTNTYTYNSTINNNNNNKSQSSQTQNNFLYPNNTAESRKNSFQTIIGTSPNTNSKPIPINNTSSSNNSTPYTSAPNSPLSFESSDTYVNDLKMNPNNPFISNINATSTINPKATTSQINTHLNINVNNMDPALSHSLISPIEFDGSGKEIKSSKSTSNNNIINNINNNNNNNNNKSTTMDSINNNNNTSQKEFPAKSRSIKKMKPLITFDKPPVVSPMAPESDSDEVGHRRRGGKKSKKYSKKRSSPAISLKTDMKEGSRDIGKKSTYTYGSNISSDPSSVITSKANKSLNSPTEEDDDVPLGIIQYKCLSSLLQESAPPNISSLQSNTKSYKSSHLKDSYGYISPSEYCSKEKYGIPKYINYSNYYHENYVI